MDIDRVTRHFPSIEPLLAELEQEVVAKELCELFPGLDGTDYLWTADKHLIPSITASFSSPYLYRGQVVRHQPCLPGVFRELAQVDHPSKLSLLDRVRCFADRVRLEEFMLALDHHPASDYAREIGLALHPYALAQHYELATDRIDLTQDHRVAAFFATNTLTAICWQPIASGTGVLYRLHRQSFAQHMRGRLECIGKQALPRPGEQKAYTLQLPLGMDFEMLPIEIFTFTHNEACGQRLNDHFSGGTALFPPDVMADVASTIKTEAALPESIVRRLMRGARPFSSPDHTAEVSIEALGLNISDRPLIALTAAQIATARAAVKTMRSTFLQNVGALAVRSAGPHRTKK